MAAVVFQNPHQRGHGGPAVRVRADQAGVPLGEHMPMLLEVHGWRRIRRLRLVAVTDGPEVREEPGHQAAISTPCGGRVVASALWRERREFGLRNAIGA